MSKQVQLRGADDATQSVRTLASRELDVNTSYKRIYVHDGVTVGGVPHINALDQQKNTFSYGEGSGTNAIAVSLFYPLLSLASGISVQVKAANTNTGPATLNVDSLGAVTIKKVVNGVLDDLGAGDVVSGVIYEFWYNGTYWIMTSGLASSEKLVAYDSVSSPKASCDFTNVFSVSKNYRIILSNIIPVTDSVQFRCQLHNGSSFLTSSYNTGYFITPSGDSSSSSSNSVIDLNDNTGSASGECLNGEIFIANPRNSAAHTIVSGKMNYINAAGNVRVSVAAGFHATVAAHYGIKFLFNSGNVESGSISIFESAS